jgi:hypothetical protein
MSEAMPNVMFVKIDVDESPDGTDNFSEYFDGTYIHHPRSHNIPSLFINETIGA